MYKSAKQKSVKYTVFADYLSLNPYEANELKSNILFNCTLN